jgi:phosphocarrier protein HPr
MIRRSLQLAGHALSSHEPRFSGVLADPLAYINPWAQCWGSRVAGECAQVQMQAEASSMHNKQMQAGGGEGEPCDEPLTAPAPSVEGGIVRVLPIINNKGLHARASAKFVQTVEGFDATVKVTRCGETVGGQSIMGLMMLAAARGTTIIVETSGQQAHACMEAIEALLADKFGEEA